MLSKLIKISLSVIVLVIIAIGLEYVSWVNSIISIYGKIILLINIL